MYLSQSQLIVHFLLFFGVLKSISDTKCWFVLDAIVHAMQTLLLFVLGIWD